MSHTPFVYIQEPAGLQSLVLKLSAEKRIGVDTESNSMHAYREQVCLIQFSTANQDYLVDPLAIADLASLAPVFADPRVEKIFHAAEYDIMTLKRDYGFQIQNVFDTHIAVRALGWKKSGLANILEQVFNVETQKRYQRADWGRRPLPDEMLDYARLDTHYLIPLRDRLHRELQENNRLESTEELFRLVCMSDPHNPSFDPDGFWHIQDAFRLPDQQAAILKELYLIREELAQHADRPPFKVLSDNALHEIARQQPSDKEALLEIKGVGKGTLHRFGDALLAAVELGRKRPAPTKPKRSRRDDQVVERYEALRTWRKDTARQQGVDSDLILPRELLWKLAHQEPADLQALKLLMGHLEWRFNAYGDDILNVIS